jgi:anaerobic selenocysteine-containing dehydrogenase
MSATARHADYVIAAKHPFERADVPRLMDATFPFPFSQYTEALVDAPEGLIEEWEFFWGLASRLGIDLRLRGIDNDRKPTADEMLDALHTGSRIPLDEVRKYPGGHIWGDTETLVGGVIPNMIGHADKKIAAGHPEVIAELAQVLEEPLLAGGEYDASAKFDFRMITYRMQDVYCTQGHNLPSLTKKRTYNPVLMNPESMKTLGVKTGDLVVVESGFGKVEAVVEESKELGRNVIGLAHGWGDPCDER